METPPVFKHVGRNFHQNVDDLFEPDDDLANFALLQVSAGDVPALRSYLEHLLSHPYTFEEFTDIWDRTGSDIYFRDLESFLGVFKVIHDALDDYEVYITAVEAKTEPPADNKHYRQWKVINSRRDRIR